MNSGATLFHSWEGFLPSNSIVMGKRTAGDPSSSMATPGTHESSANLHPFFFQIPTALRAETHELFTKMLQALGLSLSDVGVGETVPANLPARILIRMTGGSELGQWTEFSATEGPVRTITTHSLEALLANPGLKRETWNHLQAARQALQTP